MCFYLLLFSNPPEPEYHEGLSCWMFDPKEFVLHAGLGSLGAVCGGQYLNDPYHASVDFTATNAFWDTTKLLHEQLYYPSIPPPLPHAWTLTTQPRYPWWSFYSNGGKSLLYGADTSKKYVMIVGERKPKEESEEVGRFLISWLVHKMIVFDLLFHFLLM